MNMESREDENMCILCAFLHRASSFPVRSGLLESAIVLRQTLELFLVSPARTEMKASTSDALFALFAFMKNNLFPLINISKANKSWMQNRNTFSDAFSNILLLVGIFEGMYGWALGLSFEGS